MIEEALKKTPIFLRFIAHIRSKSSFPLLRKTITDPMNRLDIFRTVRIDFDFLAKITDMSIQCPTTALERVTESPFEQFLTGKDVNLVFP